MSWNKNSAKVLGITAAAAMALSLTPAAAFTAAAAPAKAGSSVSAQAINRPTDLVDGRVSKALVDGIGQTVKAGDAITVVVNGSTHTVIPTQITTRSGAVTDLTPQYERNDKGQVVLDSNGKAVVESLRDSAGDIYTASSAIQWDIADTVTSSPLTRTLTRSGEVPGTIDYKVSVLKASLQGAIAFNDTNHDVSDHSFVYNADPQKIGFTLNGKKLDPRADYVVSYAPAGHPERQSTMAPTNAGNYVALLTGRPGSIYDGNRNVEVQFTIDKLDLSKADVKVPDQLYRDGTRPNNGVTEHYNTQDAPGVADVLVNGNRIYRTNGTATRYGVGIKNELTFVSGTDSEGNAVHRFGPQGAYKYSISAADNDPNIVGTANIDFNVVDHMTSPAQVEYSNSAWANQTINTNLDSTTADKFVANDVRVAGLSADQYKVVVEKKDGESWVAATEADLADPGSYRLSVVVSDKNASGTFGGGTFSSVAPNRMLGPVYMYVNVFHSTHASVFVTVDGKHVGNNQQTYKDASAYYTGSAHKVSVRVVSAENSSLHGADLKEGTDYTVTITKDGKAVDPTKIVDHGTYAITVQAKNGWMFTNDPTVNQTSSNVPNTTLPTNDNNYAVDTTYLTVAPMIVDAHLSEDGQLQYQVKALVPKPNGTLEEKDIPAYPWNNDKAVKPSFNFTDAMQNNKSVELPADAFNVLYRLVTIDENGKVTTAPVDNPTKLNADKNSHYIAVVTDAKADDNFDVQYLAPVFSLTNKRAFEDVPNGTYFTNAAYTLGSNQIMNGYNGTNEFGPYNNLKRYEAAVVLYNLAINHADGAVHASGTPHDETDVLKYKDETTVNAPFRDVEGLSSKDMKAVAWAAHNGIVTGYGASYNKNNNFSPYKNVSLQEFTAMINRYAAKLDGYKAGAADALNAFPDAGSVASWANDGLDWAVSNKVITGLNGNIRPTWNIARADVAVMIVRTGLVK